MEAEAERLEQQAEEGILEKPPGAKTSEELFEELIERVSQKSHKNL